MVSELFRHTLKPHACRYPSPEPIISHDLKSTPSSRYQEPGEPDQQKPFIAPGQQCAGGIPRGGDGSVLTPPAWRDVNTRIGRQYLLPNSREWHAENAYSRSRQKRSEESRGYEPANNGSYQVP